MYVVVGLGNPGRRYAASRHNVGFMVIERLSDRWRIPLTVDDAVRMGSGEFREASVTLVEPQRYMNLSGDALVDALPELEPTTGDERDASTELIVVHDDMDLARGRLRIKRGGGSGGHRGVESIAMKIGTDFLRVRVGVGRPADGEDAATHVLSSLDADERAELASVVERAADAVESLICDGLEATRNRFNQRAATAART